MKAQRPTFVAPWQKHLAMALCAALGMVSAMAFVVQPEGYVGMSAGPASATSYLWSALALLFAALYWHGCVVQRLHVGGLPLLFGLVFGMVNHLGTTLFAYDSWPFLESIPKMALAAAQWVGQGLPMAVALAWMDALLRKGSMVSRPSQEKRWSIFPRLHRAYRSHTRWCCAGVFFLCWLPYLIPFYPGTMSWDMGEMLAQFFGQRPMDTWHPVFLTWVLGGCMWLGRLLGSDNLGALLFALLQSLVLAYALGYALHMLREMRANRLVQWVALCFFGLLPIWGSYAQFICKDTLYTAVLLIFTLQTLQLFLPTKGARRPGFWIGYGTAALSTCLIRSNGIYVVLPTAILVVLFLPGAMAPPRLRLRVGGALLGAVAVYGLFSGMLLPALGVVDESASGMYSVCFQQSARVLREHGDSVTPQEYAEIDRVLDGENLASLYEPWISDPVKYTFRQYGAGAAAEKDALSQYRRTWLSMLKKYPVTYLQAFIAGNSGYYAFLPKMEGETYNNQAGNRFVFETHPQVATNLDVHTSHIPGLEGVRRLIATAARGVRHIPILSLLYACATYTWLLTGACISLARQRRFRSLVPYVPAFLSLGVCMLSPVNDYFRYFLPIVAMALPLFQFADGSLGKA